MISHVSFPRLISHFSSELLLLEIMHILGFWHEHQRQDRDDYVSIKFSRAELKPPELTPDDWLKQSKSTDLGVSYDFPSLMHYGLEEGNKYSKLSLIEFTGPRKVIEPVSEQVPEPFSVTRDEYIQRYPENVHVTDKSASQLFSMENDLQFLIGQTSWFLSPSNSDIEQIQLLYQCRTGRRTLSQARSNRCTPDCPCWENAPYECESDEECQNGLKCLVRTPTELLYLRQEAYCTMGVLNSQAIFKGTEWCKPQSVQPQPAKICQKCIGGKRGDKIVLSIKTRDITNGISAQSLSLTFTSTTDEIQEFHLQAGTLPGRGMTDAYNITLENDFGCVKSMRIVAGGRDAWMADEIILYNQGSTGIIDRKLEMNLEAPCVRNDIHCKDQSTGPGGFWIAKDFKEFLGYQWGDCWEIREGGSPSKCSVTPPLTPAPSLAPVVSNPTQAPSPAPSSSPTIRNCKVPDGQGQGDFLEGECLNVATCEADGKFAVPYQVGFPDGLQDSCKAEPCDVQCCVESAPPPTECEAKTGETGVCTSDGGCDGDDVIGLEFAWGCEKFSTVCDTKCCVPVVPPSCMQNGQQPLHHQADASEGARYGWSSAIDGTTIAVGALYYLSTSSGSERNGAVLIYNLVNDFWTLQDTLSISEENPSPGDPPNLFGKSVDISGDTVIVLGREDNICRIFERNEAGWSAQQNLVAREGFVLDGAKIDDNTIVLHETTTFFIPEKPAALRVFSRQNDVWAEQQIIPLNVSQFNAYYKLGFLRKDTIGVTNFNIDEFATGEPSLFIFGRNEGVWSLSQELRINEFGISQEDNFSTGNSIAINDNANEIIVATFNSQDNGYHVFVLNDFGSWSLRHSRIFSSPNVSPYFTSVAINGDTILYADIYEDDGRGEVRRYTREGERWAQGEIIIDAEGGSPQDRFGSGGVHISKDYALISWPQTNQVDPTSTFDNDSGKAIAYCLK